MLIDDVCSDVLNVFWHRKKHIVDLHYIKDFDEKNIINLSYTEDFHINVENSKMC